MHENDWNYLSRFRVTDGDSLSDDPLAFDLEEGEGFEVYTEEDENDDDLDADWN